jgi:uncharacterized integral membrane protein (TIGR00697 family)
MSTSPAPLASLDVDSTRPPEFSRAHLLYLWLAAVYVTSLVVANMIGVKLFKVPFGGDFEIPMPWPFKPIDGISHTVGMLPFPVTFVLTDLLNEYYGSKSARRVVYVAFAMGALTFAFLWIARLLPTLEGIPGTASHEAFEMIFGSASKMYIASLLAFLAGSILDIFVFRLFKSMTGGKYVWLRATGSTVIAQVFDSFLVTVLFFRFGNMVSGLEPAPWGAILEIAMTGYVLKFVIAIALTPAIYAGRWMIREWVGLKPLPIEGPRGVM